MKTMMKPLVVAIALATCSAAAAQEAHSPIEVKSPWLRATPKGAPVIGGYATITNTGSTPDRLLGATIPMAANAQVHSMSMADGVMKMERLPDGLPVPPGATVTLQPSGNHLMFEKPARQIHEGERIVGTLEFEKAGAVPVTFAVGAIGGKAAPTTHMMPHDMPGMSMH